MVNTYKAAFEDSSEPKLIIDYKSFRIIESNKAARKIFKINTSKNKDFYLNQLVHSKKQNDFLIRLKKSKLKKFSSIESINFLTKKNDNENFNLELTQIKTGNNKQLLCNFTKSKESKGEINHTVLYDQLFNSTQNPFIITDNKFRLVYCNKASEKLFNKQASLIIGKKLEVAISASSRK